MPPRPVLIADRDALSNAAATLARSPRVALDTEGNGMHAYRTRLCVVQLCAALPDAPAEDVFVVDALALADLAPLAEVFARCELVLHDVAFDARLLAAHGYPLARAVDTSVYARFLGLPSTGLSTLLATRHSVTISKDLQQDDWARRPFTAEQLAYLSDDVAYLGPLAAGLERDAAAKGIAEEVAVETDYALANARVPEAAGPAYTRVKGARDLPPAGLAVLRELAAARDEIAARWDVPAGRVVSSAGLLALARVRPGTADAVRRAAGITDRAVAAVPELCAAIARGEAAGDVPAEDRAYFAREVLPSGEIAARKAREAALSAWRAKEAAARGVDLQVVLPGHALTDVARENPRTLEALAAVPGFGAVRVARYGPALLALLAESNARRTPPAT